MSHRHTVRNPYKKNNNNVQHADNPKGTQDTTTQHHGVSNPSQDTETMTAPAELHDQAQRAVQKVPQQSI